MFEKSIFSVVATPAPSILIRSSSFLEVTRIIITSPVCSFTEMDRNAMGLITGMDYRNGHLYVSLSTFHFVFEDSLA